MAATGTAAAAATGKLLLLLLLGLTAPVAALAGYIEVRTGRAPERRVLRPPGSAACGRAWVRGRGRGAARGSALLRVAGPSPPPARLSLAQSLAPRSGCLRRRRGQMKGVGAAGPPQPPTRRRRRGILRDTAPRALPPSGRCAPRLCVLRLRGALNGGGRRAVPGPRRGRGASASGSHLAAGAQPWLARWTWQRGCGSSPGERPRCRGDAAGTAGRPAPSTASQPFAQVWQTREPGFPVPTNNEPLGKVPADTSEKPFRSTFPGSESHGLLCTRGHPW